MIRYSVELTVILLAGMLVIGCSNNNKAGSYESFAEPENSLATLELGDDDLKIELFVSEPLVTDPVAMEIDEEGRIYVVEMRSYPMNASGLGRVKLLEDTTGDGIPDSYTIFADSLAFPKGIMRWKKGILVTDAPHLYYLQDTTGDGVADKKDVMLTGFARSNPQHNFNTPIYGIDNWIYLANNNTIGTETFSDLFGDRGSKVSYHGAENSPFLPQNAGGKNVRFKPDTLGLEMLASSSQFGHTFDAWGRHYLINNANHHYHEVISKKYRDRNPSLPDHNEIYNSSDHGNASDIYPITVNPEHQLLTDRGVFTSASALTWYLGGAFPNKYDNVTFAAEPVHNLVHADVVEDDGAVAKASRLIEQREFLASTDAWFRPVNFYIGPDGALYVVDYYRPIIEHPQWMDDEAINNKDLYEASNRGRIYRVVPKDMDAANWVNKLQLNDESTLQLVNHLESENIWWRRNAQRLLMDRKDLSAVEPLKELVLNSESPAARLHALWTLDGLNRLDDNIIAKGLIDEEAGVRMNAIKLAEKRIGGDSSLLKIFYEMVDDPVLKVKHQLAFTLGDLVSEQADEVREHILFKEIEDPWIQIAVLSGKSTRESELLDRAAENLSDKETQGRRLFFERLASMVGNKGGRSDISRLMRENLTDVSEKNEWWRTAILSGLAQTLQHKKIDPEDTPANSRLALNTFFETDLKRV
ncbi:MAG: PVC-type heme-binding CxxCH protein, partial [Balneolales bacterium]